MFTYITRPPPSECVYNLIEQTVDDRSRGPPIYRSKYSCMARDELLCNKKGCYKTMGVPKTCLCPPKNFLKKQSRCPISVKPLAPRIKVAIRDECPCPCPEEPPCPCPDDDPCESEQAPCAQEDDSAGQATGCTAPPPPCDPCCKPPRIPRLCCCQKPPIPSNCVAPICRECPKNYVHSNIVKALRMPPRKPFPRYVFHRNGHTHDWEESGYPRKYVYKDSFGCIPNYLYEIKEELRCDDLKAKHAMKFKERDMEAQIRHLDPTEHQAILCGLKINWDEKFNEFQHLPLHIDTAGKVAKKKELEEELKALEKDIQVLERHDHVFVSDTCRSFYLA